MPSPDAAAPAGRGEVDPGGAPAGRDGVDPGDARGGGGGEGPDGGELGAAAVLAELTRRGETLAAAESLTGGLLAATLVGVPGASRTFRGGLVVYATDLKASLAGVPADLLAERGPVDPDVALALAEGARRRCGADWGLSTTGVAGPDPQGGVAVGTVFIGCAGPGTSRVRRLALTGDRAAIRTSTVDSAVALLAELLAGTSRGPQ